MRYEKAIKLLEADASGKALCPAHADTRPSLSVRRGRNGSALIKCFAGCEYEDIIAALEEREQTPEISDRQRRELKERATHHADQAAVREIPYECRDVDGTLIAVHVRLENAKGEKIAVVWRQPDGTPGLGGRRLESLPLYGAELLQQYPKDTEITLCEGEKDTQALIDIGVPAVGTCCGASTIPSDDVLRCLVGRDIVLWPDNDDAGRRHMQRIAARLTVLNQQEEDQLCRNGSQHSDS
jgi:putative DNA primase/helicase